MKYLGIDYGDIHIGFAIGDDESRLAIPLQTTQNQGFEKLVVEIQKLIASEDIDVLVVGVPQMGNVFEQQRKTIEEFVEKLRLSIAIPIKVANESFSSREAQVLMRDRGPSPQTDEHAIAAMLILQGHFDGSEKR